jgi:Fluoroacetyl-CoA-specific thioesterase
MLSPPADSQLEDRDASDIRRFKGFLHASCRAGTSGEPLQGRDAPAGAGNAGHDHGHGNAALNAIRPYLDAGESAVGTAVDIRHLAATPVGRLVTGVAEVTKVDGRRVGFAVRATEGTKEIGVGTHTRAVIDLARFAAQLRQG